jgi:hypothetical protein
LKSISPRSIPFSCHSGCTTRELTKLLLVYADVIAEATPGQGSILAYWAAVAGGATPLDGGRNWHFNLLKRAQGAICGP